MTFNLVPASIAVLVSWSLGGFAIWKWGPGLRSRSVKCPLLKQRATVLADQRETRFPCSYAGLEAVDIKRCSLVNGRPLMCAKECLQQL
jgi:hypothetical protein